MIFFSFSFLGLELNPGRSFSIGPLEIHYYGVVIALGLLFPFTDGADAEGKRRVYAQAKEFLQRFQARFDGLSRCGDLLRARIEPTEETTPAAVRLGVDKHCDILIVTAVEVLEEMLAERS